MTLHLSAGVYVREKDLSDIVTTVASASAALVGYSAKGDTENIRLITSDQQFISQYGEPDPASGHYFHYAALGYLKKGNTLYCLRVVKGALYGGVEIMKSTAAEEIVNAALTVGQSTSEFTPTSGLEEDVLFQILGANPGVWNNRIGIKIPNEDIKTGSDEVITDRHTFTIIVYWQDDDGNWSEVERFKVSRKVKKDGFGRQLYLEDVINGVSKYIVVANNTDLVDTALPKSQDTRLSFGAGDDGSDISVSDIENGWDEFANPEDVDVRILINGGETDPIVQMKMQEIAESRLDCMCILDLPWNSFNAIEDMVAFRTTTQNIDSSYCALYSLWGYMNDPYNDKLVWVPGSGHTAAQYAYNDYVSNPWDSPSGTVRGRLTGFLKIKVPEGKDSFSEGDMDVLYPNQINPVQMFRGEGIVIWGDKTLQKKSSSLSYVNVRRLLIVIEKSLAASLRRFVFEGNTEITRFRAKAIIDEYLEVLSAQGAFQTEMGDKGFHVVCDTTNNTPAVIQSGTLKITVFIKPVRSIQWIELTVVPTRTGASFEEIVHGGILRL